MCVQSFDDSRGPAIRITYRISLRSSSLWDPRHPLLKVVMNYTAIGDPRVPTGGFGSVPVLFSIGRHRGYHPAARQRTTKAPGFLIYVKGAARFQPPVYR